MIKDLLDILIIAETKLDDTFLQEQFLIEGFKQPYRLDVSQNSGGLLVYLKYGIISKELKKENISKEIQVIPIELNIRKQNGCYCQSTSHQNKIQDYLVQRFLN